MNNKLLIFFKYLFILLIIISAGYSEYYFYSKYKRASSESKEWQNKYNDLIEHPEQLAKNEAELYLEKAKKIDNTIPSNEIPEVQTVLDVSQLKNQEFFKDAQNGDKILVFKLAKKAYIYRPSENKIINSGPLITVEN